MESGTTSAPSGEAAEQGLAYLAEMSPDVRGGAILAADGSPLAATGEGDRWAEAAAALLTAAEGGGDQAVEQVHVATEQGEVFAVRSGGLTAVAVTERFVLASLMAFDLRAVLRDLIAPAAPAAERES
jgi:predicted regulator of Ras-like GTPase activity (Roadblock/LC7/MglB family)